MIVVQIYVIVGINTNMHKRIKNAFFLVRDILIALGLFISGSLLVTLSWPGIGLSLIGISMILSAAIGAARINISPFYFIKFKDIYRGYIAKNSIIDKYNVIGWKCLRLGLVYFYIPAFFFIPILAIVKYSDRMNGYIFIIIFLGALSIFLQIRGAVFIFRNKFYQYFRK